MPEVPPEILHRLLRYEPSTGKLFWRERPMEFCKSDREHRRWNTMWAGKEAFTHAVPNGHKHGAIFGKMVLAHRVIWAMVTGKWPGKPIDHINGDGGNNRFKNLRKVAHQENCRNQKARRSERLGIYFEVGRWRARIRHDGKNIHLGLFDDKDDAIAARKAAEIEYGYHANHGRIVK